MLESADPILLKADDLARRADRTGALALLRKLPVADFWELLFDVPRKYSGLAALLPRMPPEDVQRSWTGNAGRELFAQSSAFILTLSRAFERFTGRPLEGATILDYGCGWGRLLRLMYVYSSPDNIFGIDPWDESIRICRERGVLGQVAVCDYLPRALPFNGVQFDLIYAYSVFTHLSERTAFLVQNAMRSRIKPGGIAAITIRPVQYWLKHPENLPPGETIENLMRTHDARGFAFAPHQRVPIEGEITYGDASISIEYIKLNWKGWSVEDIEATSDQFQILVYLKPVAPS